MAFLDVSIFWVALDPHWSNKGRLPTQERLKSLNLYHHTFSSIGISDDLGKKFEFCKLNGS